MKVAFKGLIAAAAFIAAGAASAAVVTVTANSTVYKGVKLSGSETVAFSPDALAAFDVFKAQATSNAPAVVTSATDADGFHTSLTSTAPIASLTFDGITNQSLSTTTSGGLTLTAPLISPRFFKGGSLALTDLSVDLAEKKVYATLIGGNGVGTLTHVYLWSFETMTGAIAGTPAAGGATMSQATLSGLHLTADGAIKIATSLGAANDLGRAALASVSDFGTIQVTTVATPVVPLSPCSVAFKTTSTSAALSSTDVTIHNFTSNAATGWKVGWSFSKPSILRNIQNAKITNDAYLKNFTAQPVKTNTTVAANGSTTFSFRSQSNGAAPTIGNLSATLGGYTCTVTAQ